MREGGSVRKNKLHTLDEGQKWEKENLNKNIFDCFVLISYNYLGIVKDV